MRDAFYGVGKFEMPAICGQDVNLSSLRLIGFDKTKPNDKKNRNKTVHFFRDDYKFDVVWNYPERHIERLEQYTQVLTPDFSLYTNMPLAVQVYNVFRRNWCGAYWQSRGAA